jgi:large subunit ribosomal protein L6
MQRVELEDGFDVEYEDGVLTVSHEGDEVSKKLEHPLIEVNVEDGAVEFEPLSDRRNVTSVAGTFRSHVQNMVEGLADDHVYRMKGVYAHFPMTVKQQGEEIHIENFMGERADRVVQIMDGVDVEIDGDDIVMRSPDKEAVAQTAARLEQACYKGDRDPRTFQDGVYITEADR